MRKVFLIISIDTECDKGPGWAIRRPMSFTNIKEGIPNVLTPLFSNFGIKPTYLLSPEILHDQECIQILKKLDFAEFGTHLHEEFIEPLPKWDAARTKSIQGDLTPAVEREKLSRLTALFKSRFGYQPLSFRAGRFGISTRTIGYLEDLGYSVDSSVTPYKTHYYESGTIRNCWGERPFPYRVPGRHILQVPVTIVNRDFSRLPSFILRLLEDRRTVARRILNRLGYRTRSEWFRPYRSTSENLIDVAKELIRSFPARREPVLNMMFHSNEIVHGMSPYCQTQEEVDEYVRSMTEVFSFLHRNYQVCSIGLGEYASYFR